MSDVKICGVCDADALNAAVTAGARYVGFVFYEPSPRYIKPEDAKLLVQSVPQSVRSVGLFVDPANETLKEILAVVPLDMIQLHGSETPERVQEIKTLSGKPVIKAIRVANKYDLEGVEAYEAVADWLLFDSKPADAELPGGTGQSFDWNVLKGRTFARRWMLSGGLNEDNIDDALAALDPKVVDVSSGVEREPGRKDPQKIKNFINRVKSNG